jgi:hypothetical protein
VFTESGVHTVRTAVVTAGGSPFEFTRSFTATLIPRSAGGEARSAGGLAAVRIPPAGVRRDTFILLETLPAPAREGGSTFRIGPVGALDGEAVLELAYDAAVLPDPEGLVVARVEGGNATPLPSEVIPGLGVVRARVTRLSDFTLLRGPGAAGGGAAPLRFALHPNRPNPFRGSTTLSYDLPADGPVRVAIYDVAGRLVTPLRDGPAPAGRNAVPWDGLDGRGARLGAGVYFARVTAGAEDRVLKIVLLR